MYGSNMPHVICQHERRHRITNHLGLKRLKEVTVQSPAQSRDGSVFISGGSEVCPTLPSKSPGSEIPQFSEQSLRLHGCPWGEKDFLYIQSDTPLFQLMTIAPHYPTIQVNIDPGSLFLVISSQVL